MTDPTGTYSQHPALVTATGAAAPPDRGPDATGTYAQHPAVVTRPADEPAVPANPPAPGAPQP
jgi:hypothetical protein